MHQDSLHGFIIKEKILVTGGAGFIGTHLRGTLIEDGHEVRSLDIQDPKTPVLGSIIKKRSQGFFECERGGRGCGGDFSSSRSRQCPSLSATSS
jgi:hypothetical protein